MLLEYYVHRISTYTDIDEFAIIINNDNFVVVRVRGIARYFFPRSQAVPLVLDSVARRYFNWLFPEAVLLANNNIKIPSSEFVRELRDH